MTDRPTTSELGVTEAAYDNVLKAAERRGRDEALDERRALRMFCAQLLDALSESGHPAYSRLSMRWLMEFNR